MKNKNKSVGFAILSVITLFFFVAFGGLFAAVLFLDGSTYFSADFNDIMSNVAAVFNVMGGKVESFIALGTTSFAVFMFLIAIIVSCVKKRPVVILGAIVGLLFAIPFMLLLNNAVEVFKDLILANPFNHILVIALYVVAIIYVVMAVITWIASLAVPSKSKLSVANESANEEAATDAVNSEPLPDYQPEPEPEPESAPTYDKESLSAILREIVREVVRDELAQRKPDAQPANQTITGATFSSPLVVQYFNGGIQSTPAPVAEEKKEESAPIANKEPVEEQPVEEQPAEEPVEEQPVEEVVQEVVTVEDAPVEEVKEEPVVVEEVAPAIEEVIALPVVEEVAPAVEETPKNPIVRIPFTTRITEAEQEMKDNYNELKNEILSWGVKSRVSSSGDTFRLHRKTYIKLTIAGKSLKLYFALDPKDYQDSTIPVQDAGEKNIYQDIPLVFKVKSGLSMRRAKELIQDVMEKDGLEQGEIGNVNWVDEIASGLKDSQVEESED